MPCPKSDKSDKKLAETSQSQSIKIEPDLDALVFEAEIEEEAQTDGEGKDSDPDFDINDEYVERVPKRVGRPRRGRRRGRPRKIKGPAPAIKSDEEKDEVKNKTAAVWNHFRAIDDDNAECKSCLVSIRTEGRTTGGLTRHLRYMHAELFAQATWEEAQASDDEVRTRRRRKNKTSAVWKFFAEVPGSECNRCTLCDKSVSGSNTSNMSKHLEIHHKEEFDGLQEEEDEDVKPKKKKKRGPKPTFNNDPEHRTCPDCHKLFSVRPAMLYHRKVVHSGIRPYKCEECGMTFARQDSFRGHTHSKVRSFLCSVCGKTFARKSIRDVHERAHYGDRRYWEKPPNLDSSLANLLQISLFLLRQEVHDQPAEEQPRARPHWTEALSVQRLREAVCTTTPGTTFDSYPF